ncbi:MAG: ISAs1 family transposase [Caldilineaceae bacterium]|nr:ISAs1 family transposase [Caldilineaceae bacterium]
MSRPQAPGALCAFADQLATLPDPRDRRGVRYPQAVLLGTLLVALAGGANNMAAVAAFTRDHQAWCRQWLPLGASVPTDDTYRLWVRRLDPETAMKAALRLLDGTSLPGLAELVLALDGKAARRSGDRADGLRPLHMVSAFLVREGLTLAQEPCDAKSNEITAMPRLLDRIHLEGAVVTIDAAGCQTAIVQALLALVRGHWGVENGLHRTLDVQFREDDCRLRRGHAPAVMAILRRAALNMVKTFQQQFEPDVSMGLLRDRIGRQPWILAPILA